MKRCPVCQQDYPDDSRFCGRCGRELPSADKPVVNGVPASVTMTVEDANAPASLPSMPPVAPAQPYPPTAYPPVAPSVPTDPYAAPRCRRCIRPNRRMRDRARILRRDIIT